MEVRLLTPADAAAFRALRLRALREHPEAFTSSYEEDAPQPLAAAETRLAAAQHSFWGAFQGRELYGMVGLERERRVKNRHKAKVTAMYVAPEVASQGVGRRLLEALLAQARREGLLSLVLTVTEGKDAALRLYERAGFRSFGLEPKAVRVDGRFFAKNHMVLDL
ncbi:MAG TPA: GNAT family N-acetyltransferase [Ramlibacter sp.]|nr:GNAT family N-acetyltransferase [Ramlibacter sp.]